MSSIAPPGAAGMVDGAGPPSSGDSDAGVLARVSRARAWTVTSLGTLALAVTLVHRQVLAALAATVTSALEISEVRYGCLSSGLAAALLLGSVPATRLAQRIGPRLGLALTVAGTSLVIGLHSIASGFGMLLLLRVSMGLAAAPAFPAATHAIHRVLPFKHRARGIGLLYLGNSLGSAVCPPLAVFLEARFGWRATFLLVALGGAAWIPLWLSFIFGGKTRPSFDSVSVAMPRLPRGLTGWAAKIRGEPARRLSIFELAPRPGVFRGMSLVAAAAPITLIMLIWAAKYLVHDHGLRQLDLGRYLWLPALSFGSGSLLFGELRARSARTRASAHPPRRLVAFAMLLCTTIALVPAFSGPAACILVASTAMLGAGGLYTLATADMLTRAPRDAVPPITSFTTFTQSLIYIVAAPAIGSVVEHFGNYHWVMIGAGLWVLPGSFYWLMDASLHRGRVSNANG